MGVGYLAEAYMNFGFLGMYLCALFFGFLVAVVERAQYYYLNGHYYFSYVAYLMVLVYFGNDLGTILNSLVILTGVLVLIRPLLLRMARKDDYGPAVA